MKKIIPVWQSFEYVEVFLITQYKDGCVFKTRPLGFAHRSRPKKENEEYASIPISLIRRKETIELDLME